MARSHAPRLREPLEVVEGLLRLARGRGHLQRSVRPIVRHFVRIGLFGPGRTAHYRHDQYDERLAHHEGIHPMATLSNRNYPLPDPNGRYIFSKGHTFVIGPGTNLQTNSLELREEPRGTGAHYASDSILAGSDTYSWTTRATCSAPSPTTAPAPRPSNQCLRLGRAEPGGTGSSTLASTGHVYATDTIRERNGRG